MSEIGSTLASAVVIPEPQQPSSHPNGESLKRKQSQDSDHDAKKPRLGSEERNVEDLKSNGELPNSPTTGSERRSPQEAPSQEARRKSAQDEEKKRSKRLFGGLLGTLSQSSTSSAQRRRLEIERKQQAKLRAQDEEREEDRKKRLEELATARRARQRNFEEQTMRLKHSNSIAKARMLCTKSSPPLYYLPYQLQREERDKIEIQIEAAEAEIDGDLQRFEGDRSRDSNETVTEREPRREDEEADQTETNQHDGKSASSNSVPPNEGKSEVNISTEDQGLPHSKADSSAKEKAEENEDVMVEAGEDSVIY